MSIEDIIKAWRDAEYRRSLSAEQQARLPEHPAGSIELTDEELPQVAGGNTTLCLTYVSLCDACTFDYYCPPDTLTTITA